MSLFGWLLPAKRGQWVDGEPEAHTGMAKCQLLVDDTGRVVDIVFETKRGFGRPAPYHGETTYRTVDDAKRAVEKKHNLVTA